MFYVFLSNRAVSSHVFLSTWNMASVTEKLSFFILINLHQLYLKLNSYV